MFRLSNLDDGIIDCRYSETFIYRYVSEIGFSDWGIEIWDFSTVSEKENWGLVLISAIRIFLNYTHLPFLSQSPQPPAHRAYAPAGDHRVFLIFLCALCGLCERLNGPS